MNISANTLFHFTKDIDNLISILTNCFYPRLCLESNTVYEKPYDTMAIPMVCFCDIPLGNIAGHMKNYGRYAIGLKKTWAYMKGLNPVMYVNDKSRWMDTQRGLFKKMMGLSSPDDLLDMLIYQQAFVKQYDGYQFINGKEKKLCFYNEREWRYVPVMFNGRDQYFLSGTDYNIENIKREMNLKLECKFTLEFTPKDINYIIVSKDSELLEAKRQIERIKSVFYPSEDIDLLCTKLISAERIEEDF